MYRRSITSLLICLQIIMCNGLSAQIQYNLPQVTLPSPAVQNFMRYGEIPVNHSTGVPEISIPLFKAVSGKLELPISISYHASGIKVNDMSSVVGLGWVLNAGGMVGVTEFGGSGQPTYNTSSSFKTQRDLLKNNLNSFRNFGALIEDELQTKKWQSDRHFIQLPSGQSAVFRYGFLNNTLIFLPYQPWKVEKEMTYFPNYGSNICTAFTVVDESGTTYRFDARWVDVISETYHITSMISADKVDTIRFVYRQQPNRYSSYSLTSLVDIGVVSYQQGTGVTYGNDCNYSLLNKLTTSAEPVLDSIISATSVIKFNSVGDRQDQGLSICPYRLTGMIVYDRLTGQRVKGVDFNQNYFGTAQANNQRLKLEGISISGNTAVSVEQYNFGYETSVTLPPYETPQTNTFQVDFWGYYNAKYAPSLVHGPYVPTSYSGPGTIGAPASPSSFMLGDRSPDHFYAKACMLKEIQYPTGGKTIFEFEPNYALAYENGGPQFAGNVGGFRIKKINNYTTTGVLADSKRYDYSIGATRVINKDLYSYYRRTWNGPAPTFRWLITSDPLTSLNAENGPPVFYETVTEYRENTSGQNIGKTVFQYKIPPAEYHATWDPPQIYYPCDPNQQEDYLENLTYRHTYELDRGNYRPLLLSKTDYKIENSVYYPVAKTENIYNAILPTTYNIGLYMNRVTQYSGQGNPMDFHWCPPAFPNQCYYTTMQHPFYFYPIELNATQELNVLSETKSFNYDPAGNQSMVTSTGFTYESLVNYTIGSKVHLLPTEQSMTNSKGEVIKKVFKYPADFATTPYTTMVNRNILTPLIEQLEYSNNNFVQSQRTYYDYWAGNTWGTAATDIIVPRTIESKVLNNSPEVRIRFEHYNKKGLVDNVTKELDVENCYLYGYNSSLPVAKIVGCTYAVASTYITQSILDNPTSDAILRTHLNNLRNIPGALVTTYTYKPLVGITSETDVNNKTTYYEYDEFNRLLLVKDNDKNVLKKYCYNYNGQSENCAVYYNTQQAMQFQKQCSTGYTGSYVTYTIPAGTYLSTVGVTEANQKALDDLLANGQANANALGTCTSNNVCNYSNCLAYGDNRKCINGVCEIGVKVYTNSTWVGFHQYECTYHYEWSDGSWSWDYIEYSPYECAVS